MTRRAAATRYARALFDVALNEGDVGRVEDELAGFAAAVSAHAQLREIFANPAVPAARKRAVVDALLARAGELTPALGRLLGMLADRDRLVLLDDLLSAYRDRLMEHLKVVRAEITTAVPLSDDRVQAITKSLAEATGRHVTVSTRTDAGIIGGVVTRLGSVIYDGSVARQLQKMKERMVESV